MGWNKKDFFRLTLFSMILLSLAVAWLGFGERGFVHLYRMERERQTYLEKIHQLEEENRELMEEIQRLRTDRDYIESMGRRELGLIKNDEVIYRFDRKKETAPPAEAAKEEADQVPKVR
ncbi:MAG: septum formation initiator family protein [Thermodesulfobacteriota bacterium]